MDNKKLRARMPAFEEALSAAMGQPGPRKNAEALQEILDLLQNIEAQEEDAPEARPAPLVLTPEMVRAYLDGPVTACPYCGSGEIEGNCTGDQERQQEYTCKACGEEWDEIYMLSGLTDGRDGIMVRPALSPLHAAAPALLAALEQMHWLYAPQATQDQTVDGEIMQTQGGLAVTQARAAIAQAKA